MQTHPDRIQRSSLGHNRVSQAPQWAPNAPFSLTRVPPLLRAQPARVSVDTVNIPNWVHFQKEPTGWGEVVPKGGTLGGNQPLKFWNADVFVAL